MSAALLKRLRQMARKSTGDEAAVLEWAAEHIQQLERTVDSAQTALTQLHYAITTAPPSATGQYARPMPSETQ